MHIHRDLPVASSIVLGKRCPYILILVCHLVSVRVPLTVRTDDTVAVEVIIARIIVIIVTSIAVFYLAELLVSHAVRNDSHRFQRLAVKRLVLEIPVETALELRIFPHEVPIFLEISARIAHGMIVFTLYERKFRVRILCISLAGSHGIIHRTEDISVRTLLSSRFILHRTALVL